MIDLRELNTDHLDAVAGGCRTVDTLPIDSIRAQIGPALMDPSTTNPGNRDVKNLKLYAPLT